MTKEEDRRETDLLKTTENQHKLKHLISSSIIFCKKTCCNTRWRVCWNWCLKKTSERVLNDNSVEITLVDKDNFLLFTPMLPEVASGMIETRHIVTPVRAFCKKAKFFEADVKSIDLDNKQVIIEHTIGRQQQHHSQSSSNAIA